MRHSLRSVVMGIVVVGSLAACAVGTAPTGTEGSDLALERDVRVLEEATAELSRGRSVEELSDDQRELVDLHRFDIFEALSPESRQILNVVRDELRARGVAPVEFGQRLLEAPGTRTRAFERALQDYAHLVLLARGLELPSRVATEDLHVEGALHAAGPALAGKALWELVGIGIAVGSAIAQYCQSDDVQVTQWVCVEWNYRQSGTYGTDIFIVQTTCKKYECMQECVDGPAHNECTEGATK